MSKYHPLDVRHPANRDLMRRNYLLDPPALQPAAVPASRAPGARVPTGRSAAPASPPAKTATRPASRPQKVAAPWSDSGTPRSNASRSAESALGRLMGFLRSFIILGVILVVVAQQTDLLDPVIRQIRLWAYDLGVTLPF